MEFNRMPLVNRRVYELWEDRKAGKYLGVVKENEHGQFCYKSHTGQELREIADFIDAVTKGGE